MNSVQMPAGKREWNMRKISVSLLMSCVLLALFLLCGCAADDKNGNISEGLTKFLQEAAQQKQQQQAGEHSAPLPVEPSAQPQEPETLPQNTPATDTAELNDAIAGWWLYVGEGGDDPEYPIIYYFSQDGNVYLYPEAYYAHAAGEEVFCCAWKLIDGKPVYYHMGAPDTAPVECEIVLDGEKLTIIWPDKTTAEFLKNTSQKASRFLKKGEYAYLAEAPVLCEVLYDKAIEYGCHSLLADEVVWVSSDDVDLIAEYHLEDASFFDDYELYNAKEEYVSVVTMGDDGTAFFVVDWNVDGTLFGDVQVTSDEFMSRLKEQSYPMLAYLKIEEGGFVSEIREVYVP